MTNSHPADQLASELAELEERAERGQSAGDATLAPLQAELNTVIGELRRGVAVNAYEQEPACQKVTQMVQSLGRESQVEPDQTIDTAGDTFLPRSNVTECVPLAQLGAYELLAKLGEGGMGAVYKARHMKLDKIVAIKVLSAERMKDKLAVSRFEREMRAVGKLEHPHIVRAMDAGEAEGIHYLAMEYVQGVDLSQLVKECHPLATADACELIRQAALGLDEAHDNGMVHRDIKPSNLMLCSVGKKKPPIVKILDMGLAMLSEAHSAEAQGLTTTGQMMGTLDYMAPEQGGDSKGVDIRADIYALGASLYKLLCGEAIYHGEQYQTPVQKMMALATQSAPPIQSRRTGVPNELAAVLHKMLAKNPHERFATPAEVAQALAPFCTGANLGALLHRAGVDAGVAKDAVTQPSLSHPETNTSVTAGEQTKPQVLATQPAIRKSLPKVPMRFAAACISILTIAAAVVFFVQTPQGTLRVEINDPSLEVAVKGTNVVFKKEGKEAYEIAAGDKTLVVKHGEFTFETNKFELKKHKETVVKVELVPGEVRVALADGKVLDRQPIAEDRNETKVASPWHATPEQQKWLDSVSKLPPEELVAAIAGKLKEDNPTFNGQIQRQVAGNAPVDNLAMYIGGVTRLWPLRAARDLEYLHVYGDMGFRAVLSDLTPLKGMKLKALFCDSISVKDFSIVRELPLTDLRMMNVKLENIEFLRGMKLNSLDIQHTEVQDLTPLEGMPLTKLMINKTLVADLGPLRKLPIRWLEMNDTPVADLSPLADLDLDFLSCVSTKVTDFSPLAKSGIGHLRCSPEQASRNLAILSGIKSLKLLNDEPVEIALGKLRSQLPGVAASPAAADKPVVLLRGSKPVREFKQIAGAVAEMQAGDVIEIRAPGPFRVDLEPGFATPLHIRGAGGFRPELELLTSQREIKAPLKFEHCDIVQLQGDSGFFAGAVDITNCRWQTRLLHLTGIPSKLSAKDSVFILWNGLAAYNEGTELSFDNCLMRTAEPVIQLNDATTTRIDLKRCTFYNETFRGAPLLRGSDKVRVKITSEHCIFHSRGQMELLGLPDWRKQVEWRGKTNLYSGAMFFLTNEQTKEVRKATIEEWAKLWSSPEEGSQFVEQFEPLFVHSTIMSLAELRKVAEPVVQAARDRYQLPQVGCDWNLVGPGEAYLKALEAKGQKPTELRPEVSSGGVISIIRDGKEVSAYRSLTAAIEVAKDLDILEIRTDATLPPAVQPAGETQRRITIRAGAGYSPLVEGLQSYGDDVWSLEGLAIGYIIAGPWEKEGFRLKGGIHRLQNCLVGPGKLHDAFRCVADGKEPPAIINCRAYSLHLASAKDTAIHIENSVLYKLVTGEPKPRVGTGNVELVRCTFWGLEPHFAWRDRLGGSFTSIETNPESKYIARDCYFATPESLLQIFDWQDSNAPFAWNGERNVYSTAFGFYVAGSATTHNLAEFTKFVQSEQGSVNEPSLLLDPKFWKLMPNSPGAGASAGGADLGADTTKIALPSP